MVSQFEIRVCLSILNVVEVIDTRKQVLNLEGDLVNRLVVYTYSPNSILLDYYDDG
jgi:hypothetical protein